MTSDILLPSGVLLKPISIAPSDDYMAGSDGQIYSRTQLRGVGKKVRVDWYPLQGGATGNGYFSVSLCHNNIKKTKSVHRLICAAFHGEPSKPSLQVRHLDGNRSNNLPENLAWGTQQENWLDRKTHGRGIEGEKHPGAKFTNDERAHIRWAVTMGLCSRKHAARMLGVSSSAISHIVDSDI